MSNVNIRKATKKDLPEIIKIVEGAFHKDYGAAGEFYAAQQMVDPNYASDTGPYSSSEMFMKSMIDDMRERLGKKFRYPFEIFVAEDRDKNTIGFITLENNAGNFWITNIMVEKKFQKNKVGKKLFEFVAKNKKPVYLWVNVKNPAIKFWKKLGFKEILRESLMRKK